MPWHEPGWRVVVVATLMAGCAAPGPEEVTAGSPDITYWITVFGPDGQVILTNQPAVALASVPTEERLADSAYVPNTLRAGESSPFGESVDRAIRIASPGKPVTVGPVPANDTLTGTDGRTVVLSRWHGPFPVKETVATAAFASRFPEVKPGDLVQLNPRFVVRIEAQDQMETSYAFELSDASRPYPELGLEASLTTVISPDGTSFRDRLDIPIGSSFMRRNDRLSALPHGWYSVVESSEENLTLAVLRSPLVDRAFQPLTFVVEVVESR